ncbi:HoxN/HupN/NixA family nickel/cobalt transporter [Kocuria sp. LUK]|uniref:HoxN/HupN/NixA family nickel/cobalt transporter n=1 Tax=Kocuria sp. LUK TaxID=2897828 RepID=UPI001E4CD444|nr:HoxN/HupN/NixA family nickel/cobalt transporter [Kocuria sp. LUK]MCD1145489.1 HoxN/HupN/NixA family nickel/cobalt transporter [Kocuria sp. LUK]
MSSARTAAPPTAGSRGLPLIGAAVVLLHVVGWGALLLLVAGSGTAGTAVFTGLALSAYALGVRHAFDADHIAAIDNATRSLTARGRPSAATGFWFALGHSSVVLLSVLALALGLEVVAGGLADEGSGLRRAAGIWGGTVSGLFLLTAGVLNLGVLLRLRRARRAARTGTLDAAALAAQLDRRGVLHRVLHPVTRAVDRPARMYPVGFLFGLGLDTAASIGLFVMAGGLAPELPWYAVLVLPVLFTAGMTLFDSADGVLMHRVYGWASTDARRKLDYDLTVTTVSVAIAFVIGGTGLLSVLAEPVDPSGGLLAAVAALDLNFLGVAVIVFFALAWLGARLLDRFRGRPLRASVGG